MSSKLRAFCDTVVIITGIIFAAGLITWALEHYTREEIGTSLTIIVGVIVFRLIYDLRLTQIEHDASIADIQKRMEDK